MKLTGALICAAAWVTMGIVYYVNEKRQLAALLSLSRAFAMMRSELAVRLSPIPELLKIPAEGYAAGFLKNVSKGMEHIGETSLSRLWTEALEECPPLLNGDEKQIVKALGAVLGRATLDTQLQSLSDASTRLMDRAEELRRRLPTVRKLSLGLTTAFGLLTAILLM